MRVPVEPGSWAPWEVKPDAQHLPFGSSSGERIAGMLRSNRWFQPHCRELNEDVREDAISR